MIRAGYLDLKNYREGQNAFVTSLAWRLNQDNPSKCCDTLHGPDADVVFRYVGVRFMLSLVAVSLGPRAAETSKRDESSFEQALSGSGLARCSVGWGLRSGPNGARRL